MCQKLNNIKAQKSVLHVTDGDKPPSQEFIIKRCCSPAGQYTVGRVKCEGRKKQIVKKNVNSFHNVLTLEHLFVERLL